jgi:hypothetical protein
MATGAAVPTAYFVPALGARQQSSTFPPPIRNASCAARTWVSSRIRASAAAVHKEKLVGPNVHVLRQARVRRGGPVGGLFTGR